MNHVGLFAKFWQPGRVKTRLAADLDDKSACAIYQYFLSHLINQLQPAGDARTIVYSPAERKSEFNAAAGVCWQTTPQAEGDLGHRMKTFFQQSFQAARGADVATTEASANHKTVVIGSDCPQLTAADIEEAFDRLDEQPVVLGPTDDGGYYLIGMKNDCFDVFEEIDWSTEQVLPQTRARLKSLEIGWTELKQKNDIDNLEDLLGYHSAATASSQPGDPDFVLLGAIAGALAKHQQRGAQS